jgi:hypothetical protein
MSRVAISLILLMFSCRTPIEGGVPGAPDLARASDLATGDMTVIVGVVCGSVRCASDVGQFCDSADYGVTGTCLPPTASPMHKSFACDGPEDCPGGGVCCLTPDGSACSTFGFCVSGNVKGEWMCHVQGDCGAGFFCCPVAPPSSYAACLDHPC